MKQYQYLLFDADNTLLDFSKAEALAFEETCKAAGIPFGKNVRNQPIFLRLTPIHTLNNKAIKDKEPTAVKCEVNVNE